MLSEQRRFGRSLLSRCPRWMGDPMLLPLGSGMLRALVELGGVQVWGSSRYRVGRLGWGQLRESAAFGFRASLHRYRYSVSTTSLAIFSIRALTC